MTKDLIETTKELKLLGWSEEGAKTYTELLISENVDLSSLNIPLIIAFLVFLFLIVYISINKFIKNNEDKGSINNSNSSGENIQSNYSNDKALSKFKSIEKKEEYTVEKKPLSEQNNQNLSVGDIELRKHQNNLNYTNEYKEKKLSNLNKRPLKEHLIELAKETSIDTDKCLVPIILIFLIIYDLSKELIKIASSLIITKQTKLINSSKKDLLPSGIYSKSEKELIDILGDVEIASNLSKIQLIDLITSNSLALKKYALEEKRNKLMKKTNIELKSLLKGVRNISRLKKKELVEKVLSLQNQESI